MSTSSRKLNFGCGGRFSDDWVNIDFHTERRSVIRANLLAGFPFPDSQFDAAYSSHVLEHFSRESGRFLLTEAHRVLKQGGVLRIVVPDLEGSVREYLRVLSLSDGAEKRALYGWAIIELLDQMVRTTPSGDMGRYMDSIFQGTNEDMIKYVTSRTQNTPWNKSSAVSPRAKLRKVSLNKIRTKITYLYLHAVTALIPKSLRDAVIVRTSIGERHRWMYDEYSLKALFEEVGFSQVRRLRYNESGIRDFASYRLDSMEDGSPYKNNSLYMEGTR